MRQEGSKTRYGITLHDTNPFINVDLVKTKTKKITNNKGDMMVVSKETGEITAPIAGFWQAQEVDSAQFVKLYINGVKAFKELTNAGTKVFEVLYLEVQKNIGKDRVYLNYVALEDHQNLSKATFARGLRELIEKGFVAPTLVVAWYWLNPDYMWNGDRLAFVKEYYRAPRKQHQQIPGQLELNIKAAIDLTLGE